MREEIISTGQKRLVLSVHNNMQNYAGRYSPKAERIG